MIASPGIGSGLDINSLVTQLVAAEGTPALSRLAQLEASTQAKISSFGLLKSSLSDFSDSIDALKSLSTFDGRTAQSGDLTLFTTSATNTAAIASYSVEVTSLASAQKLVSAGFATPATTIGSGSLTVSSGTKAATISIASGTDSLTDIRDAINLATEQSGVSATLLTVDDGFGGTVSKLLLTSADTGTANNITVTVDDDDLNDTDNLGLSQLVYDPAGTGTTNLSVASAATDAVISIDGQAVTRSSNTISDAIDGVTISLVKANPGNPATLGIVRDSSGASSAIDDFVTKFNALQNNISELTKFDSEGGRHGALLGNATLLTLSNQVRRQLTDSVLGADASLNTLSSLGITTQPDGTLEIDQTKLDTALADNPDGVSTLFSSFDGIAANLDTVMDGLLDSDGSVEASLNGLNATLEDIADQRESIDRSLASLETRLFAQFNAMDALVAQLQSTSDFLTQQLSAIELISSGGNNN